MSWRSNVVVIAVAGFAGFDVRELGESETLSAGMTPRGGAGCCGFRHHLSLRCPLNEQHDWNSQDSSYLET